MRFRKLSGNALDRFQSDVIFVSPALTAALSEDTDLQVCQLEFPSAVASALEQSWIQVPFDRLIVAHAAANDAPLITRNQKIRRHYRRAVW